jgi:hypothetical protein
MGEHIGYLAEYLVNIGCIQVYAVSHDVHQQVFLNEKFLFEKDVTRNIYHKLCEFPVTVDIDRMSSGEREDGWMSYRLPVISKYRKQSSLRSRSLNDLEPIDYAQELKESGWRGCFCRHCGLSLVSKGIEQFSCYSLPSEYWQELVDCWLCHEDQVTQFGRKLDPNIMIVKQGNIFVGLDYLLLDVHDVVLDRLEFKKNPNGQNDVFCRQDGAWLGQGLYNNASGQIESLKFYKYQLKTSSDHQLMSPKDLFDIVRVFVEDLTYHAKLHACYRFVIIDYHDRSRTYLHVSSTIIKRWTIIWAVKNIYLTFR